MRHLVEFSVTVFLSLDDKNGFLFRCSTFQDTVKRSPNHEKASEYLICKWIGVKMRRCINEV